MTSGLEWNIKLSEYDSGDILEKIRATFEGYWNNPEFTPFIAALDSERLRKALRSERRTSQDEANRFAFNFDIQRSELWLDFSIRCLARGWTIWTFVFRPWRLPFTGWLVTLTYMGN
jgi:hypothetical protein